MRSRGSSLLNNPEWRQVPNGVTCQTAQNAERREMPNDANLAGVPIPRGMERVRVRLPGLPAWPPRDRPLRASPGDGCGQAGRRGFAGVDQARENLHSKVDKLATNLPPSTVGQAGKNRWIMLGRNDTSLGVRHSAVATTLRHAGRAAPPKYYLPNRDAGTSDARHR